MARWLPRIRNGPPDTPSNPRRLTTDPCNKVTPGETLDGLEDAFRGIAHAIAAAADAIEIPDLRTNAQAADADSPFRAWPHLFAEMKRTR